MNPISLSYQANTNLQLPYKYQYNSLFPSLWSKNYNAHDQRKNKS